jgi:hypothetical protein
VEFPPDASLPGFLVGQILGWPRAVLGCGIGQGGPCLRICHTGKCGTYQSVG